MKNKANGSPFILESQVHGVIMVNPTHTYFDLR
jgi:hypothetical protein